MDTREHRYQRSSFFFPFLLITLGIGWLLLNNGMISTENVYRLAPFWPALLILAGLGLLLRRIWWPLDILMWGGAAVLVLWLLTSGTGYLPAVKTSPLQHTTLREALDGATSAEVNLDLSVSPVKLHALQDGKDLLAADVYSVNPARLKVSGESRKNLTLEEQWQGDFFSFPNRWLAAAQESWDIGLTPAIPISLQVNASTGSVALDLSGLSIQSITVDASTGSVEMVLPQSKQNIRANVNAGTGSLKVSIPANTPIDMELDGATGSMQVDVAEGAGVQVTISDGGVGSINLPEGYRKVQGDANSKEGVWENSAFASSTTPVRIRASLGTGSFKVR